MRRFWLRSMRIYSPNGERIPGMCSTLKSQPKRTAGLGVTNSPLLVATVCLRRQLDDGM